MEGWNKGKENSFFVVYVVAIILLLILTMFNYLTGENTFFHTSLGILIFLYGLGNVFKAPSWDKLSNKDRIKRRVVTTVVVGGVIVEVFDLSLIPINLLNKLLHAGYTGYILYLPFVLMNIGIFTVLVYFYYKFSENFISKVLEKGGLFWKSDGK